MSILALDLGKSDRGNPLPPTWTFRLYRSPRPLAGQLSLGGCDAYARGARTNYFVIVKPRGLGTTSSAHTDGILK